MGPPAALKLDIKGLFRLYAGGEHDKLSEEFLRVFAFFTNTVYLNENSIRTTLTPFLNAFFALFTQPDYLVQEKHAASFIGVNALISNLTAMSPFRNTDCILEFLRFQPANFVKILALYSARNTVKFDRGQLFDSDARLASMWYHAFCGVYKTALVREDVIANLTEHLSYRDQRLVLCGGFTEPYFGSTYIDGNLDRAVKPLLNEAGAVMARRPAAIAPTPGKLPSSATSGFPNIRCTATTRPL